uniref:Uncharacterized protein n=1 Tax=Arundo donax TaxID=35708 RepID=A0A0A9AWP4_ARUDO
MLFFIFLLKPPMVNSLPVAFILCCFCPRKGIFSCCLTYLICTDSIEKKD